jgi:hypothetical protein
MMVWVEDLRLDDLLADPLTQLLMSSDGVREDEIRALGRLVQASVTALPPSAGRPGDPGRCESGGAWLA